MGPVGTLDGTAIAKPVPHTHSSSPHTMTRLLQSTRFQDGLPARAPAFRALSATTSTSVLPEAATARRYPRAPIVRDGREITTPTTMPSLHVRDTPTRWYGVGGTG